MRLLPFLFPVLVGWVLVFALAGMATPVSAAEYTVFIGTYTGGKSEGIYRARFSTETGKLGSPELAVKTQSPSFLALHPKRPWLYAVGEGSSIGPRKEGAVSAFKIGDGTLELMNQQPSGGGGPCHLSLDSKGRCVMVANYGSGSVAAFPVASDGRLEPVATVIQHEGSSVNKRRQAGPHAHHIVADAKDRFALACDLGLDKVLVYRFDAAKGLLQANDPASGAVPPGAGPRHLVFDPKGKFVFVVNEMGSSVSSFTYDDTRGALTLIDTVSTLPEGFSGQSSCAEIQISESGNFLYASNRGHDSIAAFAVRDGKLKAIGHSPTQGKTPRHFALDPSGKWLLAENQDSDSIVVFAVDKKTGSLASTGQIVEVGKPVCVVFSNE
jgi:6-phosphogluconolactonase